MSQTQPQNAQAAATDDDPLSHLHKMSTTAGLGSGEYVAVNGAAVFALLLGLASALTLLVEVLIVLPIAAVIVSILAWRQIAASNGTQTGKGLIALALLTALGFGGFVVAREATEGIRTRNDRQAINSTLVEFGDKIKAGDFDGAFAYFSPRFAQNIPRATFDERIKMFREGPVYGKLKGAEGNGLVEFAKDPNSSTEFATTKINLTFEKAPAPISDAVTLRKEGNKWLIESLPILFPSPSPGGGR